MLTARLFKNGRSQAVRLPKECRFKGTKVGVVNLGDSVLLFDPGKALEIMQAAIKNFSPDFMSSRDQPTNKDTRNGL